MIQYYLYRLGQFLVQHLPLRLSYKVAGFLSDIHYYLSSRDRRNVKNNLRAILTPPVPGDELARLSRQVFRDFAKYLIDFFYAPGKINKAYIDKHVKITNLEYLPQVLKKGKGAIILTAHVGNWELGGFVISRLGYPLIAVALPHKERSVNNLFNDQRRSQGITIVPNNVAIRECIRGLRNNRLIALVGDRDFNATGDVMDFFGKKTRIPKGPAAFSLKTGAAIIPAFLTREEDDSFALTLEPPIFPPAKVTEESEKEILEQCVKIIENAVRRHPTQWYMFQKFWID